MTRKSKPKLFIPDCTPPAEHTHLRRPDLFTRRESPKKLRFYTDDTLPPVYTDLLVRTANPEALNATLKMLPGPRAEVLTPVEQCLGHCIVRVYGDPAFVVFAMHNQGYAELVRVLAG